jgi:hypothetical protein
MNLSAFIIIFSVRQITPAWLVTVLAELVGDAGRFNSLGGEAVDDVGNIYVVSPVNHCIRKELRAQLENR